MKPKNFLKKFQKPLDKTTNLWYNIYVIKREHPLKIKNLKGRSQTAKVENYGRKENH